MSTFQSCRQANPSDVCALSCFVWLCYVVPCYASLCFALLCFAMLLAEWPRCLWLCFASLGIAVMASCALLFSDLLGFAVFELIAARRLCHDLPGFIQKLTGAIVSELGVVDLNRLLVTQAARPVPCHLHAVLATRVAFCNRSSESHEFLSIPFAANVAAVTNSKKSINSAL